MDGDRAFDLLTICDTCGKRIEGMDSVGLYSRVEVVVMGIHAENYWKALCRPCFQSEVFRG